MGYKIFPLILLMCSVAYAQKSPVKPGKKRIPGKFADTILTNPVPQDTVMTFKADTAPFDPLDTVTMLKKAKSALDTRVNYTARDTIVYDAVSRTVYLYGDARVDYEDLQLKSDFMRIELDKTLITATGTPDSAGNLVGKPYFKQGEAEYRAEVIKYNYQTKKGYLSEFRTKEGEGYIHGLDVKKDEENNFGIHQAKYTTCELEHPHYYIGASRIKVIPNKKVVTGPAALVIEDVPTPLVLPFGIFSIKRGQSSGVIVPQYGVSSTDDRGYFLRNGGYYFGLGEKRDIQLTGDIYANLSWAARTGYRYANRYRFGGGLNFDFAYNKFGNEEDPGYYSTRDYRFAWLHNSDPKARPNTTFNANVLISSIDRNGNSYFAYNSYNPNNIVTSQLNSSVAFGKSFRNGKYNLSTAARMSQNIQTRDISVDLPELMFNIPLFAPLKPKYKNVADRWYENITLNYSMQFKNKIDTKDSILFRNWSGSELRNFYDTAARYGVVHNSLVQTNFKVFKFYTLTASTSLNEYWYLQTIRKDTAGGLHNERVNGFERAFTFSPSLGLSTKYYGIAQFNERKIRAIRHVLTPILRFTYAPDFADPSWGYYRTYRDSTGREFRYSIFEGGIVGGPSAGRQGIIGLSLDNNLEMKIAPGKNDTTGAERKIQLLESFRVDAGYNIFADSFALSNINLNAQTRLFKNISINGGAQLDPYYSRIITNAAGVRSLQRVNEFALRRTGSLGTITSANLGLNASFNAETFQKKKTKAGPDLEGELKYLYDNPSDYYDFNVPWSVNINYSITYNKYNTLFDPNGTNFVQTLNFQGDVSLTKKWKIGYTSGYDIRAKQLTFTSIDFVRDLHCWEFKLNWIPIGFRQSFLFSINVKSTLLQDLRWNKRKDWYDRDI